MSKPAFFKNLIILSLGLGLIVLLQSFIPILEKHLLLSVSSLIFFIFFTIGVYFLAEKAAQSPNLNTFSSVVLGVIFIKMVFILFIIMIYKKQVNPDEAWFLIPFFLIYLAFTIFEVYFMSKLGRIKPEKSKKREVQSTDK